MNDENDIFYKLKKKIEYDLKPPETEISTMTICLNMKNNCKFNCFNIGKYLKIDNNFIDDIIFSDDNNEIKNRKLNKKKKKKKKKEKKVGAKTRKDSFYNQVTIIVKISPEKKAQFEKDLDRY